MKPDRIIQHIPKKPNPIGLGDAVHSVLHPIAKAVDKVLKSNLANCVPCNTTRKDRLNRVMRDITKPFS